MKGGCERSWELDALREGRLGEKDAIAFERHLRSCAICTRESEFAETARELARRLPALEPSELELRRVRARVLRSAELGETTSARRPAIARWLVGIAAAAAVVAWLGLRHRATPRAALPAPSAAIAVVANAAVPEALAGTVQASGDAKWRQTRLDNVERVTLEDGALRIHVRHQEPGERFLVDTPDGVIEVRGTTFEVETFDGRTTRVAVDEGFVSWRRRGSNEIFLHAGDSWKPATASAALRSPVPRPAAASPAATSPAATSAPAPASADDGSQTYGAAVLLLNDGEFSRAADALGSYLSAYPHGRDREDASYLRAVALARSDRGDEAAAAAEQHLAAYPQSFHRKEASILIARVARHHGDCDKARRVLAPWLAPPADAEAAATIRSCGS